MRLAPAGLGPAKVEVGEGAADRHPADSRGPAESAGASASSAVSSAASLAAKLSRMRWSGAARPNSPRQSSRKSIAPLPSAWRRSEFDPRRPGGREEPWRAAQPVEIFADDDRVAEHPAILEQQGGDLAQRVAPHHGRVRLGQGHDRRDALDPPGDPRLVRHHHHLADEGGAGGPVQPHHGAPHPRVVRIARMPPLPRLVAGECAGAGR